MAEGLTPTIKEFAKNFKKEKRISKAKEIPDCNKLDVAATRVPEAKSQITSKVEFTP